MRTKLFFRIAMLTGIAFFSFETNAQNGGDNVKEKITDERGKPSFILFKENSTYKNSDAQKVFKEQLHLNDNSKFSSIKSETDDLGIVHEKFQLTYNGIKVEFSTYSLHSKAGKLESMNGEVYLLDKVNTHAVLSNEQAFDKAVKQTGAKNYLWESAEEAKIMEYQKPTGELVILPLVDEDDNGKKTEQFRLAYKFDIYATNPVSRGDMYIDAVNGTPLFYNATIKHLDEYSNASPLSILEKSKTNTTSLLIAANADTRYSGTQSIQTSLSGSSYILSEVNRQGVTNGGMVTLNMKKGTNYGAAVNFTDADNNWTAAEYNNANKDNGALDAHWGAEMTYDYWKSAHNRNSYNNAGAAIKSYVHYSSKYNNAYWNGSVMTYGDGSGTIVPGSGGFDILTSLDVAGHEIGHAVCSNTANLAYQSESGAMNEALSDIWGACIEYYAAPYKQRWLIGEDIERRVGHLALRSMSNPKVEGQPDTYGGTNWVNQTKCRPNSNNDYCGVHTNSGVLNHWFYITTEGKTGTNDKGNSYSVTGIGIDKAAKITFRMESVYLTSNATYTSARTAGVQAATDLYGAGSPEVITVTNAFYAVGVGAAYPTGFARESKPTTTTNSFALYPNPVENILNISLENSVDASFIIFNYLGQEVKRGKINTDGIDVNELNSGVYFLKVNTNTETISKEFIKK